MTVATFDTAATLALAAQRWRALFDDHADAFAELSDGARIGFVARADFTSIQGRRFAGLQHVAARARGAPMLAFEAARGAMIIGQSHFDGFDDAAIDLLFVADDAALTEFVGAERGAALGVLKRTLRRGSVMFYALKPKHELQERGYEDFLDCLGLAFLGACR